MIQTGSHGHALDLWRNMVVKLVASSPCWRSKLIEARLSFFKKVDIRLSFDLQPMLHQYLVDPGYVLVQIDLLVVLIHAVPGL